MESFCAQDYPSLDILVSDNCSQDATEAMCRALMRADGRIRYVRHQRNIGLHGNHNFCIDAGRGEFLCIFHDHDTRDPTIISQYVTFLQQHPNVGVVCSDWNLIDDSNTRIGVRSHRVPAITPGLEYIGQTIRSGRSSVGIPGAMVRRAALGNSRFGLDTPIGFGDFPLWCRLAETWDIGHIPKALWSWRQNHESHSARTIVAIADDYQQNLGEYCDEHLARWPEHRALVSRWRQDIRRYLFWALMYEVALHFRTSAQKSQRGESRSLFEIMDYRLTDEEFDRTIEQLKGYRFGPLQHATFASVQLLVHLRLTSALGWLTRHRETVRSLLRLE